jgi:hypothetical protein
MGRPGDSKEGRIGRPVATAGGEQHGRYRAGPVQFVDGS